MLKRIPIILLLVVFGAGSISAQNNEPLVECATVLTPEQEKYLDKTESQRQQIMMNKSGLVTTYVPVQHHIVRRTNGTGGMAPQEVYNIMQELKSLL